MLDSDWSEKDHLFYYTSGFWLNFKSRAHSNRFSYLQQQIVHEEIHFLHPSQMKISGL